MDPIMDGNNKVCRACLGCCPQEYYSLNDGTPSYQLKLQECVPFMDFKMILNPIICVTCATMLDRSYQLLIVARNVESRLYRYMKDCRCTEACYIMAHKPGAAVLDGLEYLSVVDDEYNFNMIVAMAPKTEIDEGATTGRRIKLENIDQDYDENEAMPNLDLMSNFPESSNSDDERSFSPLLVPYSPVDAVSSSPSLSSNLIDPPYSPLKDNNDIDNNSAVTPPGAVTPVTIDAETSNQQPKFVFVSNSANSTRTEPTNEQDLIKATFRTNNPYKIYVKQSPRAATPSFSSSTNEVLTHNGTIRINTNKLSVECPVCRQTFTNLPSHLKKHNIATFVDTISNVNKYRLLAEDPSENVECLQCGDDYKKSDGHKCPFSAYIRLNRFPWIDEMARDFKRQQLEFGNENTENPSESVNDSASTAGNESDIDNVNQEAVGNSSTLSALSISNEDSDNQLASSDDQMYRCITCQLQFNNHMQLRRHFSLKHSAEQKLCSTTCVKHLNHILTEHSYAWVKSIQCWNCPLSFTSRDCWLVHDYTQHKATFLICYICFRGFKHSQIILHMTSIHSLVMEHKHFFHLINSLKPMNQFTPQFVHPHLVDETYSRISRFIMYDYKMTHCPLCQRPCGNTSQLIRHLVMNRCTKPKCLLCPMDLDSSMHLLDHLMTYQHRREIAYTNNKVYEKYLCQICEAVFSLETAFVKHGCFDENNPYVVYKRKMGLWTCSECLIISPLGMVARRQHNLSAVHLKHRLIRLLKGTSTKNDLSCHLCPQDVMFPTQVELVFHLRKFHVERLSVLCPLCHYMSLNPENFSRHLFSAHMEYLGLQNDSISKPEETNGNDEFTCLLCDRKHWTLNSFWTTCGKGHDNLSINLQKVLTYLDMFDEDKYLVLSDVLYNCECQLKVQSGRDLFRHYRRLKNGKKIVNYCSYWASCDLCGALVWPRGKLQEHVEREHKDIVGAKIPPPPLRIRCKGTCELFEVKTKNSDEDELIKKCPERSYASTSSTTAKSGSVTTPTKDDNLGKPKESTLNCCETVTTPNAAAADVGLVLGKRKRRKTQVFRELEEYGGLLAMDKQLKIDIKEYSRKRQRYKSPSVTNSSTEYIQINVHNLEKVNDLKMQPYVKLEELDPSLFQALHCEVVDTPSCLQEDVQSLRLIERKATIRLHMMEAIERVATCTQCCGKHADGGNCDEYNDDDHSSSSTGFNLTSLLEPKELNYFTGKFLQLKSENELDEPTEESTIKWPKHANIDLVETDPLLFPIELNANETDTSFSSDRPSLICLETIQGGYLSDDNSLIEAVDIEDDTSPSHVTNVRFFQNTINGSESSTSSCELSDNEGEIMRIHNLKERMRRSEMAILFLKLRKQLHLDGQVRNMRIVPKIKILGASIEIIQRLEKKEKALLLEREKWLKTVEVKESFLRQLTMQIIS